LKKYLITRNITDEYLILNRFVGNKEQKWYSLLYGTFFGRVFALGIQYGQKLLFTWKSLELYHLCIWLFIADLRTYGNENFYHDFRGHPEIATWFQNQNCHAWRRLLRPATKRFVSV